MKIIPLTLLMIATFCYTQGVIGNPEVEAIDKQSPAQPKSLRQDLNGTLYSNVSGELMNSHVLIQAGEASLNDGNSDLKFVIRVTVKPTFGKPVILKLAQSRKEWVTGLTLWIS